MLLKTFNKSSYCIYFKICKLIILTLSFKPLKLKKKKLAVFKKCKMIFYQLLLMEKTRK